MTTLQNLACRLRRRERLLSGSVPCGPLGGPSGARTARRGVTLIEVLVVISILSLLVALLIPAVVTSRAAARRAQCRNHLHNLGIALYAEASTRGRFPASGNFGVEEGRYHSWVVNLLPWLNRRDLHRSWDFDLEHDDPVNLQVATIHVPVFTCPDDASVVPGQGNLSYAVNAGFGWTIPVDCPAGYHVDGAADIGEPLDLNGNGVVCPDDPAEDGSPSDRDLFFQTGLFFIENWPPGSGTVRHHTLDTVFDGLSQTIAIAESVRSGYDPFTEGYTGWANPEPFRNAFFLSNYVCRDAVCSEGNVDYSRANDRSELPYSREAINAALDQAEGQAPWPSSYHPGGVHILFADGRVHFLSEQVDGAVYAALLSPRGSLIEGPLAQPLVTDY